jgi:hypothetical protein
MLLRLSDTFTPPISSQHGGWSTKRVVTGIYCVYQIPISKMCDGEVHIPQLMPSHLPGISIIILDLFPVPLITPILHNSVDWRSQWMPLQVWLIGLLLCLLHVAGCLNYMGPQRSSSMQVREASMLQACKVVACSRPSGYQISPC